MTTTMKSYVTTKIAIAWTALGVASWRWERRGRWSPDRRPAVVLAPRAANTAGTRVPAVAFRSAGEVSGQALFPVPGRLMAPTVS
jgi:hypothetical protein